MTKEELHKYVGELVRDVADGSRFEPQCMQFLTVRGLTHGEAIAALALAQELGLLERTFDSHYRAPK